MSVCVCEWHSFSKRLSSGFTGHGFVVSHLHDSCLMMLLQLLCAMHACQKSEVVCVFVPLYISLIYLENTIKTQKACGLSFAQMCLLDHLSLLKQLTYKLCISRKVASNGRTNYPSVPVCLCSGQPLTELRTHQKLWFFLSFLSSLSFYLWSLFFTFMEPSH